MLHARSYHIFELIIWEHYISNFVKISYSKCDANISWPIILISSRILVVKLWAYYSLVVVARYVQLLGEQACRRKLPELMVQKRYRAPIIDPSSLVRGGPWSGLSYARGWYNKTKHRHQTSDKHRHQCPLSATPWAPGLANFSVRYTSWITPAT